MALTRATRLLRPCELRHGGRLRHGLPVAGSRRSARDPGAALRRRREEEMPELAPRSRCSAPSDGGTRQVWHGGYRPDRDMVSTETTIRYAICSTPRTGGTMLGSLLRGTGVLGSPFEFLHPRQFSDWEKHAAAEGSGDVIEFIERRRASPNGCFGIKLDYGHLTTAVAVLGGRQLIESYRFILLRRRDVLGQAISCVRAEQTGAWHSAKRESAVPRYDRAAIARRLQSIVRQTANWQRFLAEIGKRPLELCYEDCVENPAKAVRNVAEFVGVDLPEDPLSGDDPTRPAIQRTSINDEWRERFIGEMRQCHFDLMDEGKWNDSLVEEPFLISLKRFARSRLRSVGRSRWVRRDGRPQP